MGERERGTGVYILHLWRNALFGNRSSAAIRKLWNCSTDGLSTVNLFRFPTNSASNGASRQSGVLIVELADCLFVEAVRSTLPSMSETRRARLRRPLGRGGRRRRNDLERNVVLMDMSMLGLYGVEAMRRHRLPSGGSGVRRWVDRLGCPGRML